MTDKELRRMSRLELLEILIEQMEENERLRQELNKVQTELEHLQSAVKRVGTLAEAAMEINGVFEAADKAAKGYLENVRRLAETGSGE